MSNLHPASYPRQATPKPVINFPSQAVRDEAAPSYDGRPVRRGHVTVIEDAVVEAVCAQCGMTGAGLYLYLERRAGKDGRWEESMPAIAAVFRCSVRHVRDTAANLERAGFLQRTTLTGPNGMTAGIRWYLPKHSRTYRAEPTPEPTPELSCARNKELSTYQVGTSRDGGKGKLNGGGAASRRKPSTTLPADFALTDERRQYGIDKGLDEKRVERQFERFCNYAKANDWRKQDWEATWRNWVLGEIERNGVSVRTSNWAGI